MNALLIGSSGYVGQGILKYLENKKINIVKTSRKFKKESKTEINLDLLKTNFYIDKKFEKIFPSEFFDVVILASGYTKYVNNSFMGSISDEVINEIITSNFLITYNLITCKKE